MHVIRFGHDIYLLFLLELILQMKIKVIPCKWLLQKTSCCIL